MHRGMARGVASDWMLVNKVYKYQRSLPMVWRHSETVASWCRSSRRLPSEKSPSMCDVQTAPSRLTSFETLIYAHADRLYMRMKP